MNPEKEVEKHYDTQARLSLQQSRRESPYISLRNFHNWVKNIILARCVREGDVVVDLCSGKGGDIHKLENLRPRKAYFIDISPESVAESKRRFFSRTRKNYEGVFITGDCFDGTLDKKILEQVDSVSCQFSLHYAFSSEERISGVLRNIHDILVPGGLFFGVCADGDRVLEATEYGKVQKISGLCTLVLPRLVSPHESGVGVEYKFYMKDLVEGCPEYIVRRRVFEDSVKSAGFRVLECCGLWEFSQKAKSGDLWRKVHSQCVLSLGERAISGLYFVFCVQKDKR
ncbi:MAG: mRNA cap methyltransferase [Amphiamblys sp. WSBS2006]|nr:MAG: mRNA cap methyltransferase [Amphiamblys sp. WSBS2006]